MSSYQKELEKILSDLNTPFATSSFPKKIPRKEITAFLKSQLGKKNIQKQKIGTTFIYWKTETKPSESSKAVTAPSRVTTVKEDPDVNKNLLSLQRKLERLESENKGLNEAIKELNEKLEEEKERNARLRKVDAIDEIENEWAEIAYRMGESIAYLKGVTLKDILKQFGAPSYDKKL